MLSSSKITHVFRFCSVLICCWCKTLSARRHQVLATKGKWGGDACEIRKYMISLHPPWPFCCRVRGKTAGNRGECGNNQSTRKKDKEQWSNGRRGKNWEERKRPKTLVEYGTTLNCVLCWSRIRGEKKRVFCLVGRDAAWKLFWRYLQLHRELHYDRNI